MAVSVAELNAVSRSGYDDMIIKTQYEESPLYKMLEDRKRIFRGGLDEKIPVQYRKLAKTRAVNPDDAIPYSSKDTTTQVTIEPRFVVAEVGISWRRLQSNKRESQIIDIVKLKSEELMDDFHDAFHAYIYNTDDGTVEASLGPDDLKTLIATGDLYGLSVGAGDAEQWKSTVVGGVSSNPWVPRFYGPGTVSTTNGSTASIAHIINRTKFGKKRATHVISSRDMHDGLASMWYQQHGEFMLDKRTASLGLDNFRFKGCTFTEDYACPDADVFFLDLDNGIACMEDPDQPEVDDWFDLKQANRPRDVQKVLTWVGNFVIQSRRTCARAQNAQLPTQANLKAGIFA